MSVLPVLQVEGNTSSTSSLSSVTRLPPIYAEAIILIFVAVLLVHFVRRSYHQPARVGGTPVEVPGDSVKVFDIVERLIHWALFIVLGLLMVSGISIFAPGTFDYIVEAFGVAGTTAAATQADLLWHTDMVWALLGLIIIHIVWDVAVARGWSYQVIRKYDFADMATRGKSFLGLGPKVQPRHGKFDFFMKAFHWSLAGCLVILGITGIYLWNPYGYIGAMTPGFEYDMRIVHDVFAFLLVGLVALHIYFAVEPINWPVLRSVVTGTISGEAYNHDYDSARWPLKTKKAEPAPAPAPAPTPTPAPAGAPAKATKVEAKEGTAS